MSSRESQVIPLLVVSLLLSIAFNGMCAGQTGPDDAVFHFVGSNLSGEQFYVQCYYDFTLGCHLESSIFGMDTYSVNWLELKVSLFYRCAPPDEWPISEHYSFALQSPDFDLRPAVSKVVFFARGSPGNPYDADVYQIELELAGDRAFGPTPAGSEIVFKDDPDSCDLYLATTDASTDYAEFGYLYGEVVEPPPDRCPLTFGTMYLWDTPLIVKYLDPANAMREVVGASADGASRVVIEVRGAGTEPIVDIPQDCGTWIEDGWELGGDNIWRRTWKAPSDFQASPGQYDNVSQRKVGLQFQIDGRPFEGPPFFLFKPPIVFVHGLFSDCRVWEKMEQSLLVDYFGLDPLMEYAESYVKDAHFDQNVANIRRAVRRTLDRARYQRARDASTFVLGHIAVTKVDLIAHSMGGLLANLYVTSDLYRGDVNRIITIETPHSGSEFANFVLYFLFREMSEEQRQDFFCGRCYSWIFRNGLRLGTITGGAIEDLQVGSTAMTQYRQRLESVSPTVPVYAVRGKHEGVVPSPMLNQVYLGIIPSLIDGGGLFYWDAKLQTPPTFFWGADSPWWWLLYDPLNVEDGLFPGGSYSSDFVVSLESQTGGLSNTFTTDPPLPVTDHISTLSDDGVIQRVFQLLNSPLSHFGSRFSPPVSYEVPLVGTFYVPEGYSECVNPAGPIHSPHLESPHTDGLTITYPLDGESFVPGETLTVEVAAGEPLPVGVVMLAESGTAGFDSIAPYEFRLVIDNDYLGPMRIFAAPLNQDYAVVDSLYDEVQVNVALTEPPTKISVMPTGPLYMYPGEECQLYVRGTFPDSVSRDVTSGAAGTSYATSNPAAVSVGDGGLIQALSRGESLVHVENGVADEFYVIVLADTTVGILFTSASATSEGGCVSLKWRTGVRVPGSSFQVLRSDNATASFMPLNGEVIRESDESFSCIDCSVDADRTYWYKIVLTVAGEVREECGPIEVLVRQTPTAYRVYQSYPNPFNPMCTIRYDIPRAGKVSLRVFDVSGSLVRTLVDNWRESGTYIEVWDGRADDASALPSGVYLYRLEAGDLVATRKIVLLR